MSRVLPPAPTATTVASGGARSTSFAGGGVGAGVGGQRSRSLPINSYLRSSGHDLL